jgi:formylglycine-generating enzyme required for sulfatase activity
MISLRTEMKNLRIILALAGSFAAFTDAAAQAKAPGRAPGTVFRDCHECPEMAVVPADPQAKDGQGNCRRDDRGSSWMFPAWLLRPATRERNPADFRAVIMGFRVCEQFPETYEALK